MAAVLLVAKRLHWDFPMVPITTSTKKVCAFVAIVLSTLSAYAKIVRVVVRERLWRMPPRALRPCEGRAGLQRSEP